MRCALKVDHSNNNSIFTDRVSTGGDAIGLCDVILTPIHATADVILTSVGVALGAAESGRIMKRCV